MSETGGGGEAEWVTPKKIIKKRRKTSIAKFHQSKSVAAQISSESGHENQQEVQRFNPFSSSQTKTTTPTTNTNGSFAFDAGKTSKISEEKAGDFFNALSEQSGNITKGLEASKVTLSMEQKLHNRILKGQTARRSRINDVDEQPVCADDECARDGFAISRQPERLNTIPLDLSIKSQIRFKLRDTSSFKRIKTLDWSRACAQMAPETDAQLLTTSAIYYIWPTMLTDKVYPRFGGLGIGTALNFDATWAEFSKTLPAIFASLKFGLHHYFYVFHANFTVLILRTRTLSSDDSPNSTQTSMPGLRLRAIITPVSTGLREMLIKEGVMENTENNPSIFDPNNQKRAKLDAPNLLDRDHQPELDIDDDRSWDQLRAKNLIRFANKNLNNTKNHDGPQRLSSIVITEKAQVQALVNMLMKMHDSIDLPPTIISHMPFANATVRHLSVKTTTDMIQVSGPILPHHNYNLNHVLKASVKQDGSYEAEYTAERSTLGFNDLQQGETGGNGGGNSEAANTSVNGWLSGKTITYRHLAYRDGCYIH